jgi:valyl-tRNA synthetase
MPGTDHAGIATQAVVERRMLEEEKLTRHDIGRDALVERIWKWKDEYEARILNQLKQIGSSCDWRRVRFTLDEVCSKAVRRTFFKMFSDGLDLSRQATGELGHLSADRRCRRRSVSRTTSPGISGR